MVVQQHRRRRGAFCAVTAAGVAGVVATAGGCAPTSGAAAQEHRAAPRADVRDAADVLARSGSARAATSMEMAAGGTRVTIRGEGGYDFRKRMGRLTVTLPQDPAGASEHRPITELLSPATLYMKDRGAGVPADKWVRVDSATLDDGNLVTGGATDPLSAAELLRTAADVAYVGEEDLAGVPVRHYRGVADLGRAGRDASPYARGALVAAARGFAVASVPFDAYLDDAGRLRKVRQRFRYVNQGNQVTVASTTLLYDFGSPVTVRLPPEGDIFAGRIRT